MFYDLPFDFLTSKKRSRNDNVEYQEEKIRQIYELKIIRKKDFKTETSTYQITSCYFTENCAEHSVFSSEFGDVFHSLSNSSTNGFTNEC